MEDPTLTETFIHEELARLEICETSNIKLRRVNEGSENTCWIINEDLVIRINFDEAAYEAFAREARVKEVVAQKTNELLKPAEGGSPIGFVPASTNIGRLRPAGKTAGFTIDRRVHGRSLEDTSLTKQAEAALVSLLQVLKAPDTVSEARSAGIQNYTPIDLRQLLQQATRAHERLTKSSRIPAHNETLSLASCHSFVTSVFLSECLQAPNKTEPATSEPVLLHADLKGEHIILSPSGVLTGVLDWCDAVIGPGSIDIEGLAISVGASAAVRIAAWAGYGAADCAEGVFMARCNTILRLDERLNGEDKESPVWLLERQLGRAFENRTRI